MSWKDNAIGLYTNRGGWTNTAFDFVVGYAGKGYEKPNDDLAAIEATAASFKIPFIISYAFSVEYYTRQQYPMEEAKWPALHMDYPLLMFQRAVGPRNVRAVFVEVTDPNDHRGLPADKDWLEFGARVFLKKASEWLQSKKPGVKLYLLSSHPFLSQYAPGIINWAMHYGNVVKAQAVEPLPASFPIEGDKPGYIGDNPWDFWWYNISTPQRARTNLLLYKAGRQALFTALGFSTGANPPPPPPADTQPPAAPVDLVADATDSEIDLRWSPATDNVGVTRYAVVRDGAILAEDVTTPAYTDLSVDPVHTYTYRVYAFDAAGNRSEPSLPVQVQTLPEPDDDPIIEEPDELPVVLADFLEILGDHLNDISSSMIALVGLIDRQNAILERFLDPSAGDDEDTSDDGLVFKRS